MPKCYYPYVYTKPILGFSIHWLCLTLSLFPLREISSTIFCPLFQFYSGLTYIWFIITRNHSQKNKKNPILWPFYWKNTFTVCEFCETEVKTWPSPVPIPAPRRSYHSIISKSLLNLLLLPPFHLPPGVSLVALTGKLGGLMSDPREVGESCELI